MRPRAILIVIGIWTVLAVLFAFQARVDAMYAGRTISFAQALVLSVAGWYGWALLSPVVVWIARRLRGAAMLLHVPIVLVLTFVKIALTTEILRRAGFSPRNMFSLANLPVNLLTYTAIVAAVYGIDTYRRASQAQAMLAQARLELLRAQLEPHFLFNTLHSTAELMHHDVDAADRMLTRLSELLRASLDAGARNEIRLAEEIELVERYLDIERVRLGTRLNTHIDVDPPALDALVPIFILQPIVENAVRYAIAPRPAGGTVAVRAAMRDRELQIDVEDDGPGFPPNIAEGVGLRNTRARLQQLYGGERLQHGRSARGGASVRLVLPFRT